MPKPKIIGTGLSGLVGSRIVELLSHRFDFVDLSLDTGVDILNQSQLSVAFNKNTDAHSVLHLAAYTDTAAAWSQRGDKDGLCYQLNVRGTQNIVDQCQKHQKYLINILTDYVFDGQKLGSYTEEDIPHPIEWYGETKYLAEKIILNSGLNSSILRIAFPYRSYFETKADIVRKIISKLKNSEPVSLFTDQITTPTFIDDITAAVDYFIVNQPEGTYHCVGSSSQSPYDMAQMIASTFNFDDNLIKSSLIPPSSSDSKPFQKNLSLSNWKLQNLGIKMSTLAAGLNILKQQIDVL